MTLPSKKHISFLAAVVLSLSVLGQVPISDEGTITNNNCDNTVILTDSNVDDGNYGPNEDFEITICFETVLDNPLQFSIIPQQNSNDTTNIWDIDGDSFLMVYEGEVADPDNLIGSFNSIDNPEGVFFTTDNSCLTFVFVSGENSSGLGFFGKIGCVTGLQPFNAGIIIAPPFGLSDEEFPGLEGENVVTLCFQDTLSDSLNFVANPSFPLSDATGNGYEQLTEECTYIWDMGDGTVEQGVGLTEFSYAYPEPGGYLATLTIIDIMGQEEQYSAYFLMAPRPIFSNIVIGDTLCLGDTTLISGGVVGLDTVGVSPSNGLVNLNYDFIGTDSLPDGSGVSYSTQIEIFGFSDDPVITEPSDFIQMCMNIEHSYLGDLDATLICPNGTEVLLFDGFNGPAGSQYLGEPIDGDLGNPGVGFDYCFSNNAPLGTLMDELTGIPVGAMESMPAGTYLPEGNFDDFVGCPLNGVWTIEVTDNLFIDDGYIFSWGVEFADEFEIDSIFYSPEIVSVDWLENPDLDFTQGEDTVATIVPVEEGNNAYTFVVEDSFGCIHDTTFLVYVRPLPILSTVPACFLLDSLNPVTATQGGIYNELTFPTETADLEVEDEANEFGWSDAVATEFGLYTVEFVEQLCGVDQNVAAYRDTVELDFRPVPQIQPFFEDTTLCGGASVFYDAGAQEANSGNFLINWTQNGNTYNTTDYSTTVNSSGEIILTITGLCGVASDTSMVEAIEINFEGDTICDLVPRFRTVEVMPESIGGSWSANSEGIIFSSPNALSTEIIAPAFGDYVITYTDVRCPADAVSRNFKWYEQPDLTILPTNPEICYETDTLNLTAVLQGAGSGTYNWALSAINTGGGAPQPDIDLDQNQTFPPESFDPEVNYMVTVETRDAFGRCIDPGRDTLIFKPIACLYDVPNVITPNGDGLNDLFVIRNVEDFPNASLSIFNRWGQEVFSSTAYNEYQAQNGGWDPEDNAGGVYFIELKLPSIDVIESGNLTIITEEGSEQ